MIIYPPYIADTIPAFIGYSDQKITVVIPIQDNPAVGNVNNLGYRVIVKNYFDSQIIAQSTSRHREHNNIIFSDSVKETSFRNSVSVCEDDSVISGKIIFEEILLRSL